MVGFVKKTYFYQLIRFEMVEINYYIDFFANVLYTESIKLKCA